MFSRAGNSDTVEDFKEIKIQTGQEILGSPAFFRFLAPLVVNSLCITKNRIDVRLDIQFFIEFCRIAFVNKCQLVAQIVETIVDGSC